MAVSKKDHFESEHVATAELARALSHPARLAILGLLARRAECICGDLVEELPLAQATVSQHLKVLKEAGLISGSISGPRTCYCIDRDALVRASDVFRDWFAQTERSLTCC